MQVIYSDQKDKIKNIIQRKMIILTSNLDVYSFCQNNEITSFLLDTDKNNFYEETWNYISIVNRFVETISTKKENYLYTCEFFSMQEEYISFFLYLEILNCYLSGMNVKRIKIFDCNNERILEAVFCYAKKNKIPITVIGIKNRFLHKFKYSKMLRKICSIRHNYKLIKKISDMKENLAYSGSEDYYDIVFYLLDDCIKSAKWMYDDLSKFPRLKKLVLCIDAETARKELLNRNIEVVGIEKYANIKEIRKDFLAFLRDMALIENKLKSIAIHTDKEINRQLVNYYVSWLEFGCFKSIIYSSVMRHFFENNRCKMITGNYSSDNWIHAIIYNEVGGKENGPLFFKDYTGEHLLKNYFQFYEPNCNRIKLRFFSYKSIFYYRLKELGWNEDVIFIKEAMNVKKRQLRNRNKINAVLYAPSTPYPGVYSVSHLISDVNTVIETVKGLSINVLIKNHPSTDSSITKMIYDMCDPFENISVVNPQEVIDECLNKADLVITTPSTVITDTIKRNIPVICLVNCNTNWMVNHIEDQIIVCNTEDNLLRDIVNRFVDNEDFVYETIQKQNEYLKTLIYEKAENISLEEALIKYVNNKEDVIGKKICNTISNL